MTGLGSRRSLSLSAIVVLSALSLAACSGSTTAGSPAAASSVVESPPAASEAASAAASAAPSATDAQPSAAPSAAEATAVPTAIDPCQLISAAEAGQLAGATFGPGKEQTLKGNSRMCTYGAQTKNVFEVIVAVAPDAATAKKAEASAEADLEANASQLNQGLNITKLPGFAPGADAAMMELKPNSIGIQGRSMLVLRGTVFFAFSDLVVGGAAPTADAMKAEAMTVLGRLP